MEASITSSGPALPSGLSTFKNIVMAISKKLASNSLALVCFFSAIPYQTRRAADFGKRWVQSHPFILMGTAMIEATFDLDEYPAVGTNTLCAWKSRQGLLVPTQEAGYAIHAQLICQVARAIGSPMRRGLTHRPRLNRFTPMFYRVDRHTWGRIMDVINNRNPRA